MTISTFILFASCTALAAATVFIKAPCPDFKTVPDFSFDKYKGVWYEIAKYPDNWETKGDCGRLEYYKENNVFNLSNVENNKRVFITGEANGGVLYHESSDYEGYEGTNVVPVNIVAVDYDEYAIVYECIYDENTKMRHDFCWITTRNRDKKDEVIRKTAEVLKSLDYIDTTKFYWNHLTNKDCLE